jgi:hypothetical protein
MTKLEILLQYPLRRIRDSWIALGSLEITATSRIYNKEQIYKVNNPSSNLHGYVLFCTQEYIGNDLAWSNATITDAQYGEISFGNNIVSPNFTIILSADEFNSITDPVDPTFIPFQEEFQQTTDLIIDDDELNIILADIGIPFIRFDELEYSRQDLVNNFIKPALQEYFKWFPKVVIQSYPITSTAVHEHEFPTDAYSVVHVGIQQGIAQGTTSNILLRYFDEVIWSSQSPVTGHMGGRNSPRTHTGSWGAMMLDRATRQGMINYASRVHHQVIEKHGKKYLSTYTNKTGQLQVHYAVKSNNWNDIEYARLPEARRLAGAYVMKGLGAIRSQAKNDIPGSVDYSEWINRAEKIREEVITDWQKLVKFSGIIRGSF